MSTKSAFRRVVTLALLHGMYGCTSNSLESSAGSAATSYCNCMKTNRSNLYPSFALHVCEAEVATNYRLFRIFTYDRFLPEDAIPQSTNDSVMEFITLFYEQLNSECCDDALRCEKEDGIKLQEDIRQRNLW